MTIGMDLQLCVWGVSESLKPVLHPSRMGTPV
eukprot:COSAG05_NODE_1633_length_4368_cov_1.606934_4_plen_32_part_00